jgi:hypothetical protein
LSKNQINGKLCSGLCKSDTGETQKSKKNKNKIKMNQEDIQV